MARFNIHKCKFQLGGYGTLAKPKFQTGGLVSALAAQQISKYPSVAKYAYGYKRPGKYSKANPILNTKQLHGLAGGEDAKRDVYAFINSPGYKTDLERRIAASDYGDSPKPTADQYIQDRLATLDNSKLDHIRDIDRFHRTENFLSNDGKEMWESSDHGGMNKYTPGKWKTENVLSGKEGDLFREVTGEREFFTTPRRQIAINPGVTANKAGKEYVGVQQGDSYSIGKQLGTEEFIHSTQFPNTVESGLEYPRIDTEAMKGEGTGNNPFSLSAANKMDVQARGNIDQSTIPTWETINPYTRKVIEEAMPNKWELNLNATGTQSEQRGKYLRDVAELDAKRMSTQMQFGLDPSKGLSMKDFKQMLKNPTLQSSDLMQGVSGLQNPEKGLLGMKNTKARRETFKRMRPLYGVKAQDGTFTDVVKYTSKKKRNAARLDAIEYPSTEEAEKKALDDYLASQKVDASRRTVDDFNRYDRKFDKGYEDFLKKAFGPKWRIEEDPSRIKSRDRIIDYDNRSAFNTQQYNEEKAFLKKAYLPDSPTYQGIEIFGSPDPNNIINPNYKGSDSQNYDRQTSHFSNTYRPYNQYNPEWDYRWNRPKQYYGQTPISSENIKRQSGGYTDLSSLSSNRRNLQKYVMKNKITQGLINGKVYNFSKKGSIIKQK